jgi:hypothetical protein
MKKALTEAQRHGGRGKREEGGRKKGSQRGFMKKSLLSV